MSIPRSCLAKRTLDWDGDKGFDAAEVPNSLLLKHFGYAYGAHLSGKEGSGVSRPHGQSAERDPWYVAMYFSGQGDMCSEDFRLNSCSYSLGQRNSEHTAKGACWYSTGSNLAYCHILSLKADGCRARLHSSGI